MYKMDEMLIRLSNAVGVAGHEEGAAAVAREYLEPLGPVTKTPLGSLLCTIREASPGGPHIVLEAHLDEIGLIVTAIEDKGFLKVAACGGIDRRLLLAAEVTVHGREGVYPGVVCSTPPHLGGGGDKKNGPIEEFSIDVGFDRAEAAGRITPGDIVTIDSAAQALLNGHICGKALDDRAGCAAIIRAAELIREKGAPCGITVALNSLEEVGGMGAATSAFALSPTGAICVDVSHGQTPGAPKYKCGELKKGPMIGFAPILDREMSCGLVEAAKANGIAYQLEVMGGRTQTDADSLAAAGAGVAVSLVSIPQKYMHTPIEVVAIEDVENTAALIAAYVTCGLSARQAAPCGQEEKK